VDSAFDEDESELAVLILSVSLQMLPDVDCLLDKMVQVFGDLGGEAVLLQDSQDLVTSDSLNLGDAVVVTEGHTDLGRGGALSGQLNNMIDQFVGGDLHPARRSAPERETSASNTLAI